MTNHGFGLGKLGEKTTLSTKDAIAKCISDVPGVLWAHVVHKSFHYDSREATPKSRDDMQVEDRYDLVIEMTGPCDLDAIKKCARKHEITLHLVTVKDLSWHRGNRGKHPKEPKGLKYETMP